MKILLLCPCVPVPPHGGSLLRIWNQIRYFGQRHALTLALVAEHPGQSRAAQELNRWCREIRIAPASQSANIHPANPDLVHHYASPDMTALVAELARQSWDLVIIHCVYLAQYREYFQAPVVLEEHNLESELLQQHAALASDLKERVRWRAQAVLMARHEDLHWPGFALKVTVSKQDQARLRKRCPQGPVLVVNNGCDIQSQMMPLQAGTRTLFYCGLLNYRPNLDAVEYLLNDLLPRLWRVHPKTRLCLAGAQPSSQLVTRMQADPRLRLFANPSEMQTCLEGCSTLAVPLRSGSGSRLKILQALSWGLPVVSTSLGAEGLELEEGKHLLIRDDPDEFVQALLQLEAEPRRWQSLRQQGRARVEQHYDWNIIWKDYETSLLELLTTQRRLGGTR